MMNYFFLEKLINDLFTVYKLINEKRFELFPPNHKFPSWVFSFMDLRASTCKLRVWSSPFKSPLKLGREDGRQEH